MLCVLLHVLKCFLWWADHGYQSEAPKSNDPYYACVHAFPFHLMCRVVPGLYLCSVL